MQQRFHRAAFSDLIFPRIRIVAILTPHGTSLKEDNKSGTGAINCAVALRRMNKSFHVTFSFFFVFQTKGGAR
jgi:hypothetical protein